LAMGRRISLPFSCLVLSLPLFLTVSCAFHETDGSQKKTPDNAAALIGERIPTRPTGVPGHPGWIIAPVSATGMKCDGLTDDSEALQATLNSAVRSGPGNATVIMPPGTCVISVSAKVSINAPIWLQGTGKLATTLKRKDSSNGGSILSINSDGVTLSDFGLDGNKGGPGIASGADSVSATGPFSDVTIRRMRFVNSTDSDIVSSVIGAATYTQNWVVEESDFQNQSNPYASCVTSIQCSNIRLLQPLNVRILRNRSDNSQQFVLFGSTPGAGLVEVGDNIVTNLAGFGIALGGGVPGASGAHVHHNFISTTNSDPHNLIDVAFWNDFVVDHNVLHHNGVAPSPVNEPSSCIADFPPANHGSVDSNICYAIPTANLNVVGISMGGNDVSIINNFVQDCSTAGIGVAVGSQGPARGVRIIGNTAKNNDHQTPGAHAGIELFLGPGAPNLSALSDVIIRGNHSYDDQSTKTQGYGIGIGLAGIKPKFSNVIVEGNDVTGNRNGPFRNNAESYSGFAVRHNLGLNPKGQIAAPSIPPSGAALVNNTMYDVDIYITSGPQSVSIAINGTPLTGLTVPGGGIASTPIRLPANQNITLTYVGGPPTWQWIAD
jgi:hypothetical protein